MTYLLLTLEVPPSPVMGDTKNGNIIDLPPQDCLPSSNRNMWATLLARRISDPMPGSHTHLWVLLCTCVKLLGTDPSMPGSHTDLSLSQSTNNPPGSQCHHGQSSPKSHGSGCALSLAIADALRGEDHQQASMLPGSCCAVPVTAYAAPPTAYQLITSLQSKS